MRIDVRLVRLSRFVRLSLCNPFGFCAFACSLVPFDYLAIASYLHTSEEITILFMPFGYTENGVFPCALPEKI